jgi:hypothetical protein
LTRRGVPIHAPVFAFQVVEHGFGRRDAASLDIVDALHQRAVKRGGSSFAD